VADLGAVLRILHGAGASCTGLPAIDPWGHVPEHVEQAPVSPGERRILRDVLAEVQDEWPDAQFAMGIGLIHGDAYVGNLSLVAGGDVTLIDFASACTGPRDWDLAPTALYATSLGWISRSEYAEFVEAYGFDVTVSPAFGLLCRMRELRMTAWAAMH